MEETVAARAISASPAPSKGYGGKGKKGRGGKGKGRGGGGKGKSRSPSKGPQVLSWCKAFLSGNCKNKECPLPHFDQATVDKMRDSFAKQRKMANPKAETKAKAKGKAGGAVAFDPTAESTVTIEEIKMNE